jgi:hypothetical protein
MVLQIEDEPGRQGAEQRLTATELLPGGSAGLKQNPT